MGANSKEYQREYYQRHKEEKRAYYLQHRERILALKKARPEAPRKAPRRDCQRDWHLRNKYGIGALDAERMSASVNHRCEICGRHASESRWGVLVVEHCHATGVIRGMACNKCNLALGLMDDDAARLRAAADYLDSRASRRTA